VTVGSAPSAHAGETQTGEVITAQAESPASNKRFRAFIVTPPIQNRKQLHIRICLYSD